MSQGGIRSGTLLSSLDSKVDTLSKARCYDRDVPEAKCGRCGVLYYGWALLNPQHQTCLCGGRLQMLEGGQARRETQIGLAPKTRRAKNIEKGHAKKAKDTPPTSEASSP
jgi:hypothetical protein